MINGPARTLGGLSLALLIALALVQVLVRPPTADLRAIGLYMAASGVVTFSCGVAAIRILDGAGVGTLNTKIVLGAVVGALVGLISVFVVAQLMFVSTTHDLQLLAALLTFSSMVSFVFCWWVASRVTAGLHQVTGRIAGLAAGEYAPMLRPIGGDEVSKLAVDVEALAERLQAAAADREMMDRERRGLIAAISHDLRTPLASIRAMTEALVDGVVAEPTEVARYHQTTRTEVDRLSRMVDDLFQLAQMDAGALSLQRGLVALSEIAAEVVDAMQARAAAEAVELRLCIQGGVTTSMLDGALLERAIGNLVANAIEHTPAGGQITVQVTKSDGVQAVSVSDTGIGIEPSAQARIWEPFFRADQSRARERGRRDGAGLGLAIVRGIVEAHGGSVAVASELEHGTTFTVELPG